MNIYKDVTINIDPANPVTLYGNNIFYLVEIYSGVTVNLTGLNFTRGYSGAIYNSGTLNGSNWLFKIIRAASPISAPSI